MTQTTRFDKTSITINGQEYSGYKGHDGYYMNLSQVSSILNKPKNSAVQFLASESLKAMLPEGYTAVQYTPKRGGVEKLIDTVMVLLYLRHHAGKGNTTALDTMMSLAQESLDIRIENALGPIEPEKVAELTEQEPDWLKVRKNLKRSHAAFQKACQYDHYPAWDVHDAITVLVTGLTAKEARELLPVVSGEASIGLNHQASVEVLERIREMKVLFTTYRKGSWQEKVNRAYTESIHCG